MDRRKNAYGLAHDSQNGWPAENRLYFANVNGLFGRSSYTLNGWFWKKEFTGGPADRDGTRARRAASERVAPADGFPFVISYRNCAGLYFGWEMGEWTEAHNPVYPIRGPAHEGLEPVVGWDPNTEKAEGKDYPGSSANIGFMDGHVEEVKDTARLIRQDLQDSGLENSRNVPGKNVLFFDCGIY